MSLRSRLLSRSVAIADAPLVVPKDRGTGSAFGVRRAELSEPENEIDEPAPLAQPSVQPKRTAAPVFRESEASDEPEVQSKIKPPSAQLKRDGAVVNRQEEQEEEELQRAVALPDPSATAMRQTAQLQRSDTTGITASPAPSPNEVKRAQADPPADEEIVQPARMETPAADRSVQNAAPPTASILAEVASQTSAKGQESQFPDAHTVATTVENTYVPANTRPGTETYTPTRQDGLALETGPRGEIETVVKHVESPISQPVIPPSIPVATDRKPAPERPRVVIDQIDVVIGDPTTPRTNARPNGGSASALLSRRWLRR